jgi:PAS domain S-box-containing protein
MIDNNLFNFTVFDGFPEMCFLVNENGRIERLNSTAKKKLNLNDKEPDLFFDYVELCDRSEAEKIFNKAANKNSSEVFETRLFVNRSLIDVNLSFIPFSINSRQNNPKLTFISARDISIEKNRELELIRFYNVAENSVNPIQITDLNGKMIYVNKAFQQASGYEKEELLGKNPRVFGSGKNTAKFWDRMWTIISSGKVWVGEVENKRKDNTAFYTQLLISPILDKDGKVSGYFGIHRDLSEKRTLERQLVHTQKMESIGTLAAGIAHEVGNPLASISALVQVAQRSTEEPFVKEKLSLVKSQITRISKIIRDLVDFSRPSNYELHLTDLNLIINEAVEITKVGTKAKGIEFITELSQKIPLLPLVSDQIQQVFVNILLNAVDAIIEKGELTKNEYIRVTSSSDDDHVKVIFSDTGKGIREENLQKIFEPFFTTKTEGRGTGLGLWVSYGIVKSFQGEIKLKSELNKGTSFIITLPIHPSL